VCTLYLLTRLFVDTERHLDTAYNAVYLTLPTLYPLRCICSPSSAWTWNYILPSPSVSSTLQPLQSFYPPKLRLLIIQWNINSSLTYPIKHCHPTASFLKGLYIFSMKGSKTREWGSIRNVSRFILLRLTLIIPASSFLTFVTDKWKRKSALI
jgi:hypothetical protein